MTTTSNTISGTFKIVNGQADVVTLVLEPWAEQRELAPGSTAEVDMSGPSPMHIEVVVNPGEITIYGWEGSLMFVKP